MAESEGKAKTFFDNSSLYNSVVRKDQVIREYQVALEEFDMVRGELAHCVRTHGVNNFVMCRDLRTKYLALQEDRYKGALFPEDFEPDRRLRGVFKSKETIKHNI